MEQYRIFRQPFFKSLRFVNIFVTAVFLYAAIIFTQAVICNWNIDGIIGNFQERFWLTSFLFILVILLLLICWFLGTALFLFSFYVKLYDDRIVFVNFYFPFWTRTIKLDPIYTVEFKCPNLTRGGQYNLIQFLYKGDIKNWKENHAMYIQMTSTDQCIEIAEILRNKGMAVDVEIPKKSYTRTKI
jgi:hypothetical protein